MGAPLNPVPGVLRVVLSGLVDNQATQVKWNNILHFTYGGTQPSNSVCNSIGLNIQSAWGSIIASLCPSPTTLQVTTVTDLSSSTAGSAEVLAVHPGTRGDDSIPANAAMLISYFTQGRYKGGHPRTYLYVLGNADLQGATDWSTAATAEVQTKWQQFLNACLTAGTGGTTISGFCGVRYKGKFLPNEGPPHYYLTNPQVLPIPVTSALANQQMASQRGRIERRKA